MNYSDIYDDPAVRKAERKMWKYQDLLNEYLRKSKEFDKTVACGFAAKVWRAHREYEDAVYASFMACIKEAAMEKSQKEFLDFIGM